MKGLIDSLIRHQIYLEKLSLKTGRDTRKIIKQLDESLRLLVLESDLDFELSKALRKKIAKAMGEINEIIINDVEALADYEPEFIIKTLQGFVSVNLAPTVVELPVLDAIITLGDKETTVSKLLAQYSNFNYRDINNAVLFGASAGKTPRQVANEIKDIMGLSAYHAEAVANTAISGIATAARKEALREQEDIMDGWRLLATLDGRTTIGCMARDGDIIGFNDQLPPYHFRCRTIALPNIKEEYRINILGTRASKDGYVSNQLTYEGWLKTQSKGFQIDALGPGRRELWQKGVKIGKMVDDFGQPLTIQEIIAKEGIKK